VILHLTHGQAQELETLLGVSLRELSHEIAATENASYRSMLLTRRTRLEKVRDTLAGLLAAEVKVPDELVRELAHPGD